MADPTDKDIPEPDSVNLDDTEDTEDATPADEISGSILGSVSTIGKTAGKTFAGVFDILPMSWKAYHKLNRWSLWKMQKAADADALANINRPNGREDILPAKMVRNPETERNRGGWKVLGMGDRRYDSSIIGGQSNRIGKADMIHINSDDLEQGTWAETAMDAAIATNREQYLFHDASLNIVLDIDDNLDESELEMPGRPAQTPGVESEDGEETAADGGLRQRFSEVSIERPGVCQDMLVPLQSRTGYDGQLVSWNSYQNLKQEQGDQDQIREAKNRAWAGAMLDQIKQRDLFRLALIGAAILAMALFHADIGAAISSFGSGGGGGGGGVASDVPGLGFFLIPFMPWGRQ